MLLLLLLRGKEIVKKKKDMEYKSSSYQMTPRLVPPLQGWTLLRVLQQTKDLQSIMVYKTMAVKREAQKVTHWVLQLSSLISGMLGIYAAFKFHNELHIPNVYTLHSWLGLITISLFGLQWILGFFLFMFLGSSTSSRAGFLNWHALLRTIIFLMAVCISEMGIAEKFIFTGIKHGQEALILNFTGLLIFLFAVSVGLAVILPQSF